MNLIIDIQKEPPNTEKIETEEIQLKTVFNKQKIRNSKINIVKNFSVVGIFAMAIAASLDLMVFDSAMFVIVIVIFGVSAISSASFFYFSHKLAATKYSLELLDDIDSALYPEILALCQSSEDVRRYHNKLIGIRRPVIRAEYLAMRAQGKDEALYIENAKNVADIEEAKIKLKNELIG